MKHLLYLIFSSMESFSIIFLGLILFRQRINSSKIVKCISIGITLACFSLLLNLLSLENISPILQMILMAIMTYFSFKRKIVHTLLIALTPYFIFALVQTILIFILEYYNLVTRAELIPFTFKGYSIQFFSFILVLLLSAVVVKTNEGYSFVPDESLRPKVRYTNKLLSLVLGISMLLIGGLYYDYKEQSTILFAAIILAIGITISTFLVLYITLKRDKEESED